MNHDQELRESLRRTGAKRAQALQARDEASAELVTLVAAANAAGFTVTEIAELSQLSRQGVYDFLKAADS